MEPYRRRSPLWVRDMPLNTLHAVATKLQRLSVTRDLSERQEWLWDALMSELEYRRRHPAPGERACVCALCLGPFLD